MTRSSRLPPGAGPTGQGSAWDSRSLERQSECTGETSTTATCRVRAASLSSTCPWLQKTRPFRTQPDSRRPACIAMTHSRPEIDLDAGAAVGIKKAQADAFPTQSVEVAF